MSFVFRKMAFTQDAVVATDFDVGPHPETCGCAGCAGTSEGAGDGLSGLSGTKPVWTLGEIVGNFQRSNSVWPKGSTIVYSFREALPPGADADVQFVAFTTIERQMTRAAFDLISDLIGLTFVEAPDDGVATGDGGRIYFAKDTALPDYEWGHAQRWSFNTTPQKTIVSAEVWLNADNVAVRAWFEGGYNFQALMHEILHTLGIPHPGDYNADGNPITYAQHAKYAQDSRQFTIMSYFGAEQTGSDFSTTSGWSPATPMLHDVAVLQNLYGANFATRSGDTVYGYNSTAGRRAYDFTAISQPVTTPDGVVINPAPIFTIWDGGGLDTLDFSLTSLAVNVDLDPGAFSDAFGMTNNISIAHGVWIENAIGGTASDRINGNEAANELRGLGGADTLDGRGGDDRLFGDEGADTFIISAGRDTVTTGVGSDIVSVRVGGSAVVTDFSLSGEEDRVDLTALINAGSTFDNGRLRLSQDGADTLIESGDPSTGVFATVVRLQNVDRGALQARHLSLASIPEPGAPVLIIGTEGPDTLNGTAGREILDGRGGDDVLNGGAGDDILIGGGGANVLNGGDGHDVIVLPGASTDYWIEETAGGWRVRYGAAVHTVTGVEAVRTDAGEVDWASFVDQAFDGYAYLAAYSDVRSAFGIDNRAAYFAYQHYFMSGHAEGRDPDAFNGLIYAASNPDLARYFGMNERAATLHYLHYGAGEGRLFDTFDPLIYAASNPDLARHFGNDAFGTLRHYLLYGVHEGRETSGFDPLTYTATHPDLARIFGSDAVAAVDHYLTYGALEGRATSGFDPLQYAASNADLARFFGSNAAGALRHYLDWGVHEGRATIGFDGTAYLLSNPDLGYAGFVAETARRHWLDYGADEGRGGDAPFGREQGSHTVQATQQGSFDWNGDRDWYALQVSGGGSATVTLSGSGAANGVLSIHDHFGRLIVSKAFSGGESATLTITATQAPGGAYVVVTGALGGYALNVSQSSSAPQESARVADGAFLLSTSDGPEALHAADWSPPDLHSSHHGRASGSLDQSWMMPGPEANWIPPAAAQHECDWLL